MHLVGELLPARVAFATLFSAYRASPKQLDVPDGANVCTCVCLLVGFGQGFGGLKGSNSPTWAVRALCFCATDNIESNMSATETNVEGGVEQLRKASRYQVSFAML